jgi:hypothetical protein
LRMRVSECPEFVTEFKSQIPRCLTNGYTTVQRQRPELTVQAPRGCSTCLRAGWAAELDGYPARSGCPMSKRFHFLAYNNTPISQSSQRIMILLCARRAGVERERETDRERERERERERARARSRGSAKPRNPTSKVAKT